MPVQGGIGLVLRTGSRQDFYHDLSGHHLQGLGVDYALGSLTLWPRKKPMHNDEVGPQGSDQSSMQRRKPMS